jgi:CDP-4-dehydro-6-deoxyglucose reductase
VTVRDHLSQHERAENLPLITNHAAVVDISPMDRSRNREVLRELVAVLDRHGTDDWERDRPEASDACRRWVRDRLDELDYRGRARPLNEYLRADDRGRRPGAKLAALQERYLRPYPALFTVTVEADVPLDFVAGQYLCLRYQGTHRAYSVASSPTRDEIEFCVRRVPGGRMTSDLAVTLDVGDEVTLRGPYGELVMETPSKRDLVFLATGTGVAPFKSMIDFVFEEGRDIHRGSERDVWLFLGVGWEDDLPYHRAFRALAAERENFHYVPTLSRERYLTDWDGETDYVQETLVKYVADDRLPERLGRSLEKFRDLDPKTDIETRIDPNSAEVYGCGLNAMVDSLARAVDRLGVPEQHTEFEGFG